MKVSKIRRSSGLEDEDEFSFPTILNFERIRITDLFLVPDTYIVYDDNEKVDLNLNLEKFKITR